MKRERNLDIYGSVKTEEALGEKNLIPFRFQGQYEDEETGLKRGRPYSNAVSSKEVIDKEASTYRTLSDGERVLSFIKFRRDIEEEFFIAKDKESITDFVVSELFVDICKRNGLLIDFKEV